MKQLKILLIIVGLLIGIALVFILKKPGSTLSGKEAKFLLEDYSMVDFIQISSGETSLEFTLTNNQWILGDQQVNQDRIVLLLETLSKLEMEAPVAKSQQEEYTSSIESSGVTLELFSDEKLVYRLKYTIIENSNAGIVGKSRKPYYIRIKGFSELLLSEIIHTRKAFWRNDILFDLGPKQLASISIIYPKDIAKSFHLNSLDLPEDIQLMNHQKEDLTDQIDQEALNTYLHFFSDIAFESPDTNLYKPLVTSESIQFAMRVNPLSGDAIVLEGYPLVNSQTMQPEVNKFLGIINNEELIQLDFRNFDPILVKIDYFLKN